MLATIATLTPLQRQIYSIDDRFRLRGGDGWSHLCDLPWVDTNHIFDVPTTKSAAQPAAQSAVPLIIDIPSRLKVVTNFSMVDTQFLCRRWRYWMGQVNLHHVYTPGFCKAMNNGMGHVFALLERSPFGIHVVAIGHAFATTNKLIGDQFFDVTTLVTNPAHRGRDYASMLLESMLFFAVSCDHPHCFIHVPDDCFEFLRLCDKYDFNEFHHYEEDIRDMEDLGVYQGSVAYTTLQRVVPKPYQATRYRPDFVYRPSFPGKLL